jgi:hypothetical protein
VRFQRSADLIVNPVSSIKLFSGPDKIVKLCRWDLSCGDELCTNVRGQSIKESISETAIGPAGKSIFDHIEPCSKVRDMVLFRHNQSMKIGLGSTFRIFKTPTVMKLGLELLPGGEPDRTFIDR